MRSSVKLVLKALLQRMGEWGWVPVSQDVEENQGFRTHTYLFLHPQASPRGIASWHGFPSGPGGTWP